MLLSEARVLISNFSFIYCLISSSTCHHKSNAGLALFLRDVSFNGVIIEPIRKLKPKNGNFRRVSETICVLKLSHVRPISCGTVMFLMSACLLHAGQQLVSNQLLQIGLNIKKKKHTDKIRVLRFVHNDSSRKRSKTSEFTQRSVSKEALRQNKKFQLLKYPYYFLCLLRTVGKTNNTF